MVEPVMDELAELDNDNGRKNKDDQKRQLERVSGALGQQKNNDRRANKRRSKEVITAIEGNTLHTAEALSSVTTGEESTMVPTAISRTDADTKENEINLKTAEQKMTKHEIQLDTGKEQCNTLPNKVITKVSKKSGKLKNGVMNENRRVKVRKSQSNEDQTTQNDTAFLSLTTTGNIFTNATQTLAGKTSVTSDETEFDISEIGAHKAYRRSRHPFSSRTVTSSTMTTLPSCGTQGSEDVIFEGHLRRSGHLR
ncbi:hypothetical protein AB6A40_003680 [Gnathostoma spinigerum]|uniref:Uncharacterized protein n=1 Tax=Gnathostoma spinigerum TaxID=75299 RepID=A0ABD6EBE6_9BILA